jgi:protein-tyrosine-phosphatase
MAAGLLAHHAAGRVSVQSAGSEPSDSINPSAVAVMKELGIDIGSEQPNQLTDHAVRESDVVITMGCGDACPFYPGKRYLDWEVPDPAGLSPDQVRPIRDEIDRRVLLLLAELLGDT